MTFPERPKMDLCPCGGQPTLETAGLTDYVRCTACDTKGPEFTSGEEYAIAAWNEMCRDMADMDDGY